MANERTVRAQFRSSESARAEPQANPPPAPPAGQGSGDAAERLVPEVRVSVDGARLAEGLSLLQTVEVDLSLSLVHMATLVLDNPWGTVGDAGEFDEGRDLEIEVGYVGGLEKVFKGQIVSLEPSFPSDGDPTVLVRAFDYRHRHRRGRRQRTFLGRKASDIVRELAGEEGLSAQVEDSGVTHDYLLQNNQTNMEFIHELARRCYFEVHVDEEQVLHFRKPRYAEGKALSLIWERDLLSFYVRKSSANVPTRVDTRYWDMKRKKHGSSGHETLHGRLSDTSSPQEAERAFKKGAVLVTARPCRSADEAQALAWSLYNESALRSVRGRGTALGDPGLRPGQVIELQGLGPAWSGEYYVTRTLHTWHAGGGYVTQFHVHRTGAR